MGRRKSRLLTLVKLSPLYLLVAALLYVLIVVDKDYDYLDTGRKFYESREYDQALYYLDMAVDRKIYRGSRMLEVLLLRARTLATLKGHGHALDDLEKIIQLRPNSEIAREARSLKGDILANQLKYKESLAVFEKLIEDTDEEESESLYEYQSKAAAVSHNIASVMLLEAEDVLKRNLDDPSREIESINLYSTDLQQNYSPAWLRTVLLEHMTANTCEHVLLLAAESSRYFRYAYKILEEYPYRSAFNPMSSNFLAKILYSSKRYLPAMIECTLALKEPLDRDRRLSFQMIMADIYQDLECFGKAAEIYESIRGPLKRPNPGLVPNLRASLNRDILFTRLKNGDFDRVVSEGRALMSSYKADPVVKYCTGAAYLMKKDPFNAIPLLQDVVDVIRRGEAPQYLAESPARKECFQLLFQTHMLARSFQNALSALDFSILIYPDDLELRRRRALLLDERLERYPEAGRDYLFLLNHGPRNPKTFDRWIRTQEAAFMYRKGMTFDDRASQLLDQFERRERSVNRDAKRKVERFTELTLAASFPEANNEPALKLALSDAFMARGRREQGKSILRMLSRSMPDNLEFPYRLGKLYFQEGNIRVALRDFEIILEKDPLDFEAIKMVLDCYRELNDFIGEGRLIQSVLNSGNPDLRVWMLARLQSEKAKHQDFFKLYDASATLPGVLQTDLDLMAARCCIAENRMGAAAQIVGPILEIEPQNLEALIIKAHLLPAARAPGGEGNGVLPESGDEDPETGGTEEKGTDETEPPPGEEPGEEAVPIEPEPPTELELLVDTVHALGPSLCEGNLDEMCGLLIERGRPDLVLRLTTDLETVFPLSMDIIRKIARALHASGKTEEGAALLICDDADPEDFRWSSALVLPPVSGEHILRDIVLKTRDTEVEGEFLLRAAGSAALRASLAEGARYLGLASQCQDKGAFTTREAETIDALTRLLLLYAARGLDIVPVEEASQVEAGDDLETAVNDEEATSGGTEPPPPMEERPRTQVRFTAGVDQDTQEITPPEEDEDPLPPLTGDTIKLDGLTLNERYIHIVPEAVYFLNKWQENPEESIPWIRALLHFLLLRHAPGFETECLEIAGDILAIDPACGIAAMYVLARDEHPEDPKRIVLHLTPVISAVPDDLDILIRIGPALAEQKIDAMAKACLNRVKALTIDPRESKRFEARMLLAGGDREKALTLCRELIAEGTEDAAFLKTLVPMLIQLDVIGEIRFLVSKLFEAREIDEETAGVLIPYLESVSPSPERMDIAEMLLQSVPPWLQPGVIEVLARNKLQAGDTARLEELSDVLIAIRYNEGMDWDALYRAFRTLAAGSVKVGNLERAIELLEFQYYLRPDRGDPLRSLSTLALSMGRIRQAMEYLELYNQLHPYDAELALELAQYWFFELGAFKKAHDLVREKKPFLRENPPLAMQIILGYDFIRGDLEKALEEISRQRFMEGIKTPDTLFLTAATYYLNEDYDLALRLYTMLNMDFEDNRYTGRTSHLIERIKDHIDQQKKSPEKKKKQGNPKEASLR